MKVVILIPRRADNGRRDQIWAWVKARWQTEQPEWKIFEGVHNDGPFNRSLAINRAAKKAGKWDVAIIADSDSFVGKPSIDAAVSLCVKSGQMTLAYDRFCYLSFEMSNAVMAGYQGDWYPGVEWYMPGTCSSMVVVTRKIWDEAEGFDEGFIGWGMEDVAASHKFQTFGGGLQRVHGECWHLHHPTAPHTHDDTNVPRMERYSKASYDVDKMRALIAELKADRRPRRVLVGDNPGAATDPEIVAPQHLLDQTFGP